MKKCFVIMPFSATSDERTKKYWNSFFKKIKEIYKNIGYEAFRSEVRPRSLTKTILQDLAFTDIVFAVLTDSNPNVWYELGIRNSQRLGTIMAIQAGQELPFDIDDYGVIHYNIDSKQGTEDLKKDIVKCISDLRSAEKDSPVSDFLNTDIQNALNISIARLNEVMSKIKNAYEQGNDKGIILKDIRKYAKSLGRNINGQVSIIERGVIKLHEGASVVGDKANNRWIEKGQSVYNEIIKEEKGIKFVKLDAHKGRASFISFDTFIEFEWVIIAEGHCKKHELRLD